jgi:hypothetical protein
MAVLYAAVSLAFVILGRSGVAHISWLPYGAPGPLTLSWFLPQFLAAVLKGAVFGLIAYVTRWFEVPQRRPPSS